MNPQDSAKLDARQTACAIELQRKAIAAVPDAALALATAGNRRLNPV